MTDPTEHEPEYVVTATATTTDHDVALAAAKALADALDIAGADVKVVVSDPAAPDYPRPAFADDLRDETVFSIPDHETETGRLVETGSRITVTDFRHEADRIYIVGRSEDGALVSHGFALTRPLLIHSEPVAGPLALWLRAMAGWAEVDLDAETEAAEATR